MRGVPRAASAWPSEDLPSRLPIAPVLGRIVRSEDFERLLAQPAHARSAHFAVHFAGGAPSRATGRKDSSGPASDAERNKLSTCTEPACQQPVDDRSRLGPSQRPPIRVWLGAVVPKRHARRAVTRNLIKRQIRSAAQRLDAGLQPLPPGLWLVRMRAPFDRAVFASAASAALTLEARRELDALLLQCRNRDIVAAASAQR